jgi:hypothetical protein
MSFTPPRSAIANITNGYPAVVTTKTKHGLSTGNLVRLHVPINYGMSELNQKIFVATVIDYLNFSLQYTQIPPAQNVNSTQFVPFVIPNVSSLTAEVLCIGSAPTPMQNPIVYFQNNVCVSETNDAIQNIQI